MADRNAQQIAPSCLPCEGDNHQGCHEPIPEFSGPHIACCCEAGERLWAVVYYERKVA